MRLVRRCVRESFVAGTRRWSRMSVETARGMEKGRERTMGRDDVFDEQCEMAGMSRLPKRFPRGCEHGAGVGG